MENSCHKDDFLKWKPIGLKVFLIRKRKFLCLFHLIQHFMRLCFDDKSFLLLVCLCDCPLSSFYDKQSYNALQEMKVFLSVRSSFLDFHRWHSEKLYWYAKQKHFFGSFLDHKCKKKKFIPLLNHKYEIDFHFFLFHCPKRRGTFGIEKHRKVSYLYTFDDWLR